MGKKYIIELPEKYIIDFDVTGINVREIITKQKEKKVV